MIVRSEKCSVLKLYKCTIDYVCGVVSLQEIFIHTGKCAYSVNALRHLENAHMTQEYVYTRAKLLA